MEPSGDWSNPNDTDTPKPGGVTPKSYDDDDDDDLIEISQPGFPTPTVKQEPAHSTIMLERTPAQSQSREASTPSSAIRQSSKKRPIVEIDLTGSDDEDDESPMPPIKRSAHSFGFRGISLPESRSSLPPQS